jgi:hypothetical protein
MNWFAHAVLIAWVPLVLTTLGTVPPRRAVLATLIGGWLFLPVGGLDVTGYQSKSMVLAVGLLAAALRYAPARLFAVRARLVDLPMAVWCVVPLASSLANGLGWYEGSAAVLSNVLHWGVPYLIGRAYFSDPRGPRNLAEGILVGGLLYLLPCLWEVRMSPQLHAIFYGFHQHDFSQTVRPGSTWRPMVFMQHGLMVALWMAAASLVALWFWLRRTRKTVRGVPMAWIALALVATTLLMKSVGGVVLLAAGASLLLVRRARTTRALLVAMVLTVPTYMTCRAIGAWSGSFVVAVASHVAAPNRVASLEFRLRNEEKLVAKALQRPVLGWGRYGRFLVYDEDGHEATPDSFWVIALGQFGAIGLAAMTAAMLVPVLRIARRLRDRAGSEAAVAPALALAIIVCLYVVDCLFNAMINPVYAVAAGALASVDVAALQRVPARRRIRLEAGPEPLGVPSVVRGAP